MRGVVDVQVHEDALRADEGYECAWRPDISRMALTLFVNRSQSCNLQAAVLRVLLSSVVLLSLADLPRYL
jgi:hypothetical protein